MGIQKPEEQQPKIQEPEKQDPARSSELGANSDLAPPELADPDPGEFAAPHSPPPAGTDTEIDPGTDTGTVADQAQITTLPETSGASLARLALAGVLGDRLLVARGGPAAGGRAEMCARAVSLLPPLLRGWASLARIAILPGAAQPSSPR